VCITAQRSRRLVDLLKDFVNFQSRPSQVRYTFSSTIGTGKKGKTEVGDEDEEGVKNKYAHISSRFF